MIAAPVRRRAEPPGARIVQPAVRHLRRRGARCIQRRASVGDNRARRSRLAGSQSARQCCTTRPALRGSSTSSGDAHETRDRSSERARESTTIAHGVHPEIGCDANVVAAPPATDKGGREEERNQRQAAGAAPGRPLHYNPRHATCLSPLVPPIRNRRRACGDGPSGPAGPRRARGRERRAARAEDVALDEDFWREIQESFTLDRTLINLNNGGVCPSPRVVHEAMKRYLDISNQAPAYHMWQVLEPNIESVRAQLAAEFGCDTEELASHAQRQRGAADRAARHRPEAGDEVVTTNQDYPRMLDTWQQRVRRDGIVLKQISFPVPPRSQADLVSIFDEALSPRTKVLHFCHITNLTGQIFPVRDVCRDGTCPRHRHDRGRRTCVRALPVHAGRPRVRLLRHEPAQVAAGAGGHGVSLRPAGANQGALAAHARQRVEGQRHPEVRGDRHASGGDAQRDRRGAASSTTGSAARGKRRACATCGNAGRGSSMGAVARRCSPASIPAQACAIGLLSLEGWIRTSSRRTCARSAASSRRRSSTPSSRACASRRTSTRRSTRSMASWTPSRRFSHTVFRQPDPNNRVRRSSVFRFSFSSQVRFTTERGDFRTGVSEISGKSRGDR